MVQIPDAPWIRETELTGHYRFGYWNTPPEPEEDEDDEFEEGDDYLEQDPLEEAD